MPQVQLPIFPAGSVEINGELACRVEGEQVVYFNGHLPVFAHAKSDLASFRLFTSQLIVQGSATQGHVAKAFGVPLVAIKRATKLYRERGPAGFFVSGRRLEAQRRKTRASPGFTRAGVWAAGSQRSDRGALGYIAQGDQGRTIAGSKKNGSASACPAAAEGEGLESTGSAAGAIEVRSPLGRVQSAAGLLRDAERPPEASTLSDRSLADSQAEMGYGTTRPLERVMASCGLLTSAELSSWPPTMCLTAGCFARCRLFWPKVSCATHAPFTDCRRDSTRWSRSFWPWLFWHWCVAVRWSRAVTSPPGSGANSWAWTGYRKSKPCGEKSPTSVATTVRLPNGRAAWLGSGWPAPAVRALACSTPTAMCAFITVASPICHAATWLANGSACEAPPITGSMGWMVSRFSS